MVIAGNADPFGEMLNGRLADLHDPARPVLLNTDASIDAPAIIARCQAFAASVGAGGEGLIVSVLRPCPHSVDHLDFALNLGSFWAFLRYAALAWAPRGIRVNAIGCGVGQPADIDPVARGRASAPVHAPPASVDDVVRTIRFIAGAPSMTGQFIRLGGV